jgi:hypothetical protein
MNKSIKDAWGKYAGTAVNCTVYWAIAKRRCSGVIIEAFYKS